MTSRAEPAALTKNVVFGLRWVLDGVVGDDCLIACMARKTYGERSV